MRKKVFADISKDFLKNVSVQTSSESVSKLKLGTKEKRSVMTRLENMRKAVSDSDNEAINTFCTKYDLNVGTDVYLQRVDGSEQTQSFGTLVDTKMCLSGSHQQGDFIIRCVDNKVEYECLTKACPYRRSVCEVERKQYLVYGEKTAMELANISADRFVDYINLFFQAVVFENGICIIHTPNKLDNRNYRKYVLKTFKDDDVNITMNIDGKNQTVKARLYWYQHYKRKEFNFNGFVFDPATTDNFDEEKGVRAFNLWKGLKYRRDELRDAYEQIGCNGYLNHIKTYFCKGDDYAFTYFMVWYGFSLLYPERRTDTCIILRGESGCGKSSLINCMGEVFGSHYSSFDGINSALGPYNPQLAQTKLAFIDEAEMSSGAQYNTIKTLITGDYITTRDIYCPTLRTRNRINWIMASNSMRVVYSENGERRWVNYDCSAMNIGAEEKIKYFNNLHSSNSPLALAYYAMMIAERNTGFDFRRKPQTEMDNEQNLLSLDSVAAWWRSNMLQFEGNLWSKTDVYEHYHNFADGHSKKESRTKFWPLLGKCVDYEDKKERGGKRNVLFPPKDVCYEMFITKKNLSRNFDPFL
eukprot:Nk52_evm8s240 gene=Nk52_evmTU8s240